MKALECLAVSNIKPYKILYFTHVKNILEKTSWLSENCTIQDAQLNKSSQGNVTAIVNCVPYYFHSEDLVFDNLNDPKFSLDVYHWKYILKSYDIGSLDDLISDIIGSLPHGSGINYNWNGKPLKNGKLKFSTFYDGMHESGYYCHTYPFRFICHINHKLELKLDRLTFSDKLKDCCGYGLRDYLEETLDYFLSQFSLK